MSNTTHGKPMPVEYNYIMKCEWFRTFTLWQRIGILFGSGLVVQIGIVTRHNPGPFQPLILGHVSKDMTPDAHHERIINNMLAEKKESPIQNEQSRPNQGAAN